MYKTDVQKCITNNNTLKKNKNKQTNKITHQVMNI